MAANVGSSAAKVLGTACGVAIVGDIATLLKDILALYDDVKATGSMFVVLTDKVQSEKPLIERLEQGDKFTKVDALREYMAHLVEIKAFLDEYNAKSKRRRLFSNAFGRTRDRIQQLFTKGDRIWKRLGLEIEEASAQRLEEIKLQNDRLKESMEQQFREMLQEIKHNFDRLGDVVVRDLVYEAIFNPSGRPRDQLNELRSALDQHASTEKIKNEIAKWYVSKADIAIDESAESSEDIGLHFGKLKSGADVAVAKVQLAPEKENAFKKHVETWYDLRNPHVLPFYGANAVAKPAFFVMARAAKGNFNEFLPKNPLLFWKVFLDVARGLHYLHTRPKPIVHSNLKCSNLLVMADGTGVVSDFEYAFPRTCSAMSEKEKAKSSLNWRAPECFSDGSQGNARVESDVYSLGMCLYEGWTGAPPYNGLDDDAVIAKVKAHELPSRPDNMSDKVWNLITSMCDKQIQPRTDMLGVIRFMGDLAEDERVEREQRSCDGVCSLCGQCTSSQNEDCP